MLATLLAEFQSPTVDYHALAPEIVLAVGLCAVLIIDLFVPDHRRWITGSVTSLFLLGAFVPVVTLAVLGDGARSLFDGRYVVDDFALTLKGLFLLVAYVVVLLSTNEMEEGRYYQGEYYVLLISSVLGMVMMSSSRDLISVFVALEFLSIPAYMMAAWRKRDSHSNEAGVKYYLLGVFASAVLLYGMSLLYGIAGSTLLADIGASVSVSAGEKGTALTVLAVVFCIVGFAFKVSAVPFHSWAPDTYQGAPTPVTAFLSVGSKAAGFVGLIAMVYLAFPAANAVYEPFLWVLAALTMTIGNLLALRQTNIVRMLAYSSVSQGGFILMPLAVAGTGDAAGPALRAVVVYLVIYAATNLGAFAVIIAATRTTHSGEISSYSGLFNVAPGLTVLMTIFLASLAGIPPLGGWYAKFGAFKAVIDAGTRWSYVLAIVAAVNAVVATAYYITVMREMWMKPSPEGRVAAGRVPGPVQSALVLCGVTTLVLGVFPGLVGRFGDLADLTGALGR